MHALSWRLIKATSYLHWDIMAYVDQDRTPGMSITKKVPLVIAIVRMASASVNVLLFTHLVSSTLIIFVQNFNKNILTINNMIIEEKTTIKNDGYNTFVTFETLI